MNRLYQHTDYRAFLREWFAEAKEAHAAMSYRFLASKLGLDPGFLVHVFHGQKHLAEKHIPALAVVLKLKTGEAEYFRRLVLFGKAKGSTETKRRYEELMQVREGQVRQLSTKEHRYYKDWYIPVVRCLLGTFEFRGDWEDLGGRVRPPITAAQANEAVTVLRKLGLVTKNDDGVWEPTDSHLSSGDAWTGHAIQGFQRQMSELGLQSLEETPKEEREISTLTFGIPSDDLPDLREMVREFRSKLARWAVSKDSADAVYQMNIQIFPVSQP
ncbi:MAG: TIGR02147 family protein [Fibrobacterota bacterium]